MLISILTSFALKGSIFSFSVQSDRYQTEMYAVLWPKHFWGSCPSATLVWAWRPVTDIESHIGLRDWRDSKKYISFSVCAWKANSVSLHLNLPDQRLVIHHTYISRWLFVALLVTETEIRLCFYLLTPQRLLSNHGLASSSSNDTARSQSISTHGQDLLRCL